MYVSSMPCAIILYANPVKYTAIEEYKNIRPLAIEFFLFYTSVF
jgi:hypothetical protein